VEQIDVQPVSRPSLSDTQDPRNALIEALCPHWRPRQVRFERALEGGYRNRNYRFAYDNQDFVLRVPGTDTGIDRAVEQIVLEIVDVAFGPNSNPNKVYQVPKVVAFDATTGAMISEFCPWPLLAETAGVGGAELGHYLAGLHDQLERSSPQLLPQVKNHPHCEQMIIADLSQAGASASVRDQVTELTRDRVSTFNTSTFSQPTQLSHQDLNPWNLLVDDSAPPTWMTLDWETLGLNLPLFDLVTLLEGYGLEFDFDQPELDELRDSGLRAYNGARQTNFGRREYRQAQTLFSWREYAWAAAQIQSGNRRKEITGQHAHYANLLMQKGFTVIQS